ncbi:MAG: hypothetical protein IJS86_05580 [Lachnospiraceae bacterium]|nr:hypothetical protein [Lachnospiraceae bacterium]
MAISPILMNGTVSVSQDISVFKQNDDNKAAIAQSAAEVTVDEQTDIKDHSVQEQQNVDTSTEDNGQGGNLYGGDGGARRRKKQEDSDGKVVVKKKGGFDISI